ncbi:MAG: tetratricopeptide repeat protein [Chloroflexota bacterium]
MVINRSSSRYPRRGGPTCMGLIMILGGVIGASLVFANFEEVTDAIIPSPTPEPTRSAESFALSASLYARDGEIEQAVESYKNAISLDSQNPNYYIDLIDLFTLIGDAEDALEFAERVNLLAPDNPEVLISAAQAYLLNGERLAEVGERDEALAQYERAVVAAERAITIDPNIAEAYAFQAGALIRQDRDSFIQAQELVDFAIALDTSNPKVHYYRGLVFETQGYYDRAIESYESARQLNPAYTEASLSLAYTYFYTDKRQRAINTLKDLIDANNNNASAYDALGWMLFLAGQYAEAEAYLEDAVALDPEMVRAHAHLGAAYFKNFNYDNAIPRLEDAVIAYEQGINEGISLTDSSSIYYNYLGFAYYRTDPTLCGASRIEGGMTANELFTRVIDQMGTDGIRGQNAQVGLADCQRARIDAGG